MPHKSKRSAGTHSTAAMPHVLYLMKDEKKLFDNLSGKLKEGWEVKEEKLKFEDTDGRRRMRIELMHLHDPSLIAFQEKARSARNEDEVFAYAKDLNLLDVQESDLAEIYFALGPTALGAIISSLFTEAGSDTDVESVAALTNVRHALLESMQPVS